MNDKNELVRLSELVSAFERLDTSLISDIQSGIQSGNWEIISQTMEQTLEAKKAIKRFLSERGPLNVEPGLRLKLKKIRDNYGYAIDRVVDAFGQVTGTRMSQESEEGKDYIDALFSEGTADYVDEQFFTRRNQIGTLIVGESLPDHFVHHFRNLRECFDLGLFETTVIYCRAVIETGCFEALRRRGQVNANLDDFREFSLKSLMYSIKPFIDKKNWDSANKVIKKADGVLHSKREKVVVKEEEAFNAVKDTFAVIEELFSGNPRTTRRR
jgi:hypothetical protein